ncbi:MAG: phosphoribosylamine--glycine ligase [Roseiflexaceae bacterium]
MGLRILIIGGGGREHALAWALARSPGVAQIYVAPGNAGTSWPASANRAPSESLPVADCDLPGLLRLAQERRIDLTVVGPEAPLAAGLVDAFQERGLRVFGPSRAAARLEASKVFAKVFMREQSIPTADFAVFEDYDTARRYVARQNRPLVIKADGLAAGKGVVVCDGPAEALAALRRMLVEREFGAAGATVLVEERLAGREVSLLAFSDGRMVAPMPPARDHKRVYDGDRGPNTGGMGAYAPAHDLSAAQLDRICRTILQPAIDGMAARGTPYVGVLYAGLMLTKHGPQVLEFNCRFGDPETQVILPLLETSLDEVVLACVAGRLDQVVLRWRPGACATVVLASPGYPGTYPKGLPIVGLDASAFDTDELKVFHAGTAGPADRPVTSGGRVLAVSGLGADLRVALAHAYAGVERVSFEGMHYRRDIGGRSTRSSEF